MNNFSSVQVMLQGLCFLAILQGVIADDNECKTPQLGKTDPLLITIFDSNGKMCECLWAHLCEAVRQFPQGLVTVEYRPGAQAVANGDDLNCGSGNCKTDQFLGCQSRTPDYNDCYKDTEFNWADIMRCYCSQEINEFLLENAGLRATWNVPEDALPTWAVNRAYDPCFKFGNYQEILDYLCQVYQKQVGNCG